ncbi:MAG: hypothetical protein QMD85_00950 [Candidatus Aenigmarchaeota archaeon]|nr:hypothetical protein [Candidatus Aenigmarchaeota archaeon]MDI6722107.1 hypothetical protein [Candidatus Aenigmarchaeota archaeon]
MKKGIAGGYVPIYTTEELKEKAERFSVNDMLKQKAYRDKPLDFEEAYLLGVYALSPYKECLKGIFNQEKQIVEKQSIAALCALHDETIYRSEQSPEQIAGICAAVFDYDIATSENGFLMPKIEYAMDNCGMGGDLYRTPNVSTIAALIAAADNIQMCKHGSPGNTDSTGSSDFLRYLGVNLFSEKENVERDVEKYYFGYTDALDTRYKSIHVQTHKSAHLAHMNDIIGPITNPLHPSLMKKRVLGVNHLMEPKRVAEAYNILNEKGITDLQHGLFVRGFVNDERDGGIDEVSIFRGGTTVAELKNGKIDVYNLCAEDFGIHTQKYFETPGEKAKFSRHILEGEVQGTPRDLVLANAAILEYLAKELDFKEGFRRAKEALEYTRYGLDYHGPLKYW